MSKESYLYVGCARSERRQHQLSVCVGSETCHLLDDCDLDGLRKSLSLEPVDGVAGTRSFSASTSDAAVGALVHMLQGILDTACCLSMTFCSRVIGHGDYYFRC